MTSVAQHELYVVLPTVIMILIAAQQLKMPISIYSSHIGLGLKLSSPNNINFMGAQTFPSSVNYVAINHYSGA